jgi:cell division protein FtsQ
MTRQKKFKKTKMPKAISGAGEFVLQRMAGIVVSVIFVVLAWVLITAFLERSDYFRLRSVEAKGASEISLIAVRSDLLKHYKDNNIFKINLKAIAASLEPRYPDAKDIIVKRALPDKLLVELNFRKPVAILANGQSYPVDREGVVLVNRDPSRLGDLPVIKGIDTKYAGKLHRKNESKNLSIALDLLDEIKRARFLDKYVVHTVDASDIKSMSFYLGEGGPLVIIGYEDLKERLYVLKDTLRDPRLVLDKINYIDVRFKDVAISPK